MRTHLIVLSFAVLISSFAGTAAAQREPTSGLRADVTPSVAPHLTDESFALEPPDAGDYVLPVLGVVLGGAATIAGVIGVLGAGLVLAVQDDDTESNADAWLGGSAALAVVGALSLGISIAELRNLHHRANGAGPATTGVRVIEFTPTPGGAVVGVSGTY